MATVKQVAERAGVSLGTVSNVLNRPEVVSEALRDRVLRAIDELGFVRNESARQLRAGVSRTVAVVVLDVANPFFTDVVTGAEALAEEHDALVVVCNSGGSTDREAGHLRRLAQQRPLGLLLSPVEDEDTADVSRAPLLEALRRQGTAVVLVDRGASGEGGWSVSVDDRLGGHLAGRHLAERGHHRVAFVGGPIGLRQVADRLAGLREALAAAGLPAPEVLEVPELSVRAGAEAAARLLARPADERPGAAFCANDLLALGALNECVRRGVAVPAELAVVGYDDIDFAATASVPLTSVRQPRAQLGRTAVQLLLEQVAGRPARRVVFDPELVVRASTTPQDAPPAPSDPSSSVPSASSGPSRTSRPRSAASSGASSSS
ncbi:LacI family DNA-binding transcriptional regulator [Kineococcus sp. SYSU DK004]|uniref:LacI family DNA-binding transcriptional regulator n=1 Tax=Kineococcus sp. SYSU DK004 TaxID=3383125 RepID=UPI003D7ED050